MILMFRKIKKICMEKSCWMPNFAIQHTNLLEFLDHVYFVHPSTDTRPMYRSICRPILDRYVGRHIDRHSADISTEICRSICRSICRPTYRSIGRSTYRPRVFVRLSAAMSIDRLPTLRRYLTDSCVLMAVACVADVIKR